MNTIEILEKEISDLSETLERLEIGSEEYQKAVQAMDILIKTKQSIEMDNAKFEFSKMKDSYEFRKQNTDRIANVLVEMFKSLLSYVGIVQLTIMVLEFEKEGALRSKIWQVLFKLFGKKQ